MDNSELSSSLEDYLEVILQLIKDGSVARVKDIADLMQVKRSSVTIALRNLSERSLINYSPYSVVTLTPQGEMLAKCVSNKHSVLKELFVKILGVDISSADAVACKVEHGLDKDVFNRIEALVNVCKTDNDLLEKIKTGIEAQLKPDCENCDSTKSCCSNSEASKEAIFKALASCEVGTTGILKKILSSGTGKQRLFDMGFTLGATIKILERNPKTDTLEVIVHNYQLPLRVEDARRLLIEV